MHCGVADIGAGAVHDGTAKSNAATLCLALPPAAHHETDTTTD